MMTGTVNHELEAQLQITIQNPIGQPHKLNATVDTGFNGFLTLPPAIISSLQLPWLCRQQCQLADGSIHTFDVHVVTIEWHNRQRSIEVESVDAPPLIGMELMRGSELRIDVRPGALLALAEMP